LDIFIISFSFSILLLLDSLIVFEKGDSGNIFFFFFFGDANGETLGEILGDSNALNCYIGNISKGNRYIATNNVYQICLI
jgi:hypothetical protein